MKSLLFLSLFLLPACAETICEPVSQDPTGDLAADLVGSWDGAGTDSRLVYVFEDGGAWRWIEPPNRYAPQGLEGAGTWAVDGAILTLTHDGGSPQQAEASVSATVLTLVWGIDQGEEWEESWTRASCSGYGF